MKLPTRRSIGRPRTARKCNICWSAARALGGFLPKRTVAHRNDQGAGPDALFDEFYQGTDGREVVHDDGVRAAAHETAAATKNSASWSCRSFPTKRARSAWTRCSASSASTRMSASSTSRSIRTSLLYYQEAQGRTDSRRRHHRSRFDVVVHRRRHARTRRTAST